MVSFHLIPPSDEAVSLAVQKGMDISRSHLHFFKHNDMSDLERILEKIRADDIKVAHLLVDFRF